MALKIIMKTTDSQYHKLFTVPPEGSYYRAFTMLTPYKIKAESQITWSNAYVRKIEKRLCDYSMQKKTKFTRVKR